MFAIKDPIKCGQLTGAELRSRPSGNLVLAHLQTTTHEIDVLWDPQVSLPLCGAQVVCNQLHDRIRVDMPTGSRVAQVADVVGIPPSSPGNAARWACATIIEWLAAAAFAMNLVPVGRRLARWAQRTGYRVLPGIVERTAGVAASANLT
jgi:hypothetical protein